MNTLTHNESCGLLAQTPPTAPTAPTGLMDLPSELRLKIFEYLAVFDGPIRAEDDPLLLAQNFLREEWESDDEDFDEEMGIGDSEAYEDIFTLDDNNLIMAWNLSIASALRSAIANINMTLREELFDVFFKRNVFELEVRCTNGRWQNLPMPTPPSQMPPPSIARRMRHVQFIVNSTTTSENLRDCGFERLVTALVCFEMDIINQPEFRPGDCEIDLSGFRGLEVYSGALSFRHLAEIGWLELKMKKAVIDEVNVLKQRSRLRLHPSAALYTQPDRILGTPEVVLAEVARLGQRLNTYILMFHSTDFAHTHAYYTQRAWVVPDEE